ncbi:DUF4189 domain-containing protein [Cognatilysobacter terrigena]|uniref:DUF4189 domain-containing protein n=1 Tax=Cognatilysobacter terrigena TaxID=2488749 RepID=UPI00105B30B3|nr:DUF4189 domain-containing protein [Lysobacter terrigena]
MTKRIFKMFGLLLLALAAGDAGAQYEIGGYYYSCPAGAGWNDPRCTREPAGDAANESPSDSSGGWINKWGAVYVDPDTGSIGATTEGFSGVNAARIAQQRCEKNGSRNCQQQTVFVNTCVVVAWPSKRGMPVTQTGHEVEDIARIALRDCGGTTSACELVYQSCATPQRIR